MALIIADRVFETTTTTGTGTYTLAGAKTGFQSFAAVGNGNTTYYACTDGVDYEVGLGTYTASGTTLARTTIIESSNSDAAVNWGAGEKSIFVTLPASKTLLLDANDDVTQDGDLTVTGNLTVQGTTITVDSATAQTIVLGDNDKMTFGAGSDLQIYHTGGQSIIEDAGQGNLVILATDFYVNNSANTENMLTAINDGAVTLFYNNAAKLATTSTGIDVTGTVTADGLTVDGTSTFTSNVFISHNATPLLRLEDTDTALDFDLLTAGSNATIRTKNGAYPIILQTNELNRVHVSGGGDISFYEDTGTTAKFFWDASAESLGIGTGSPSSKLHISQATDALTSGLQIRNAADTSSLFIYQDGLDTKYDTGTSGSQIFRTNSLDRMTLDASGNLLVGTTGTDPNNATTASGAGTAIRSDGRVLTGVYEDFAADFNRINLDGEIIRLSKDGATVGSIGAASDYLYIYSPKATGGAGIGLGNSWIYPCNSTGSISDATFDLGISNARYKNLYLSNGVYGNANALKFSTDAGTSQHMTLDTSGNLLVGKTSTDFDVAGIFMGNNVIHGIRSNAHPLALNRQTSDGDIIQLYKDGGTPVGSIGSRASVVSYIALDPRTVGVNGAGLTGGSVSSTIGEILPTDGSGAVDDDAVNLGDPSYRFKNLYLSGGVVFGDAGGSGTSSSNTFDSYEEGTWTPTFSSSTMGTSLTSSNTTYVKVGKVVTIKGIITFSGTAGNVVVADYFQLGGLPFTHEGNGHGIWWQSTSYATGVRNSGHCMTAGQTIYGGCEYAGGVNRSTGLNFAITYEVD